MRIPVWIWSLLTILLYALLPSAVYAQGQETTPVLAASADDASNVRQIGHLGGATYAVAVAGNRAYVGEGPSLTILDITNPAQPVFLGKTRPLPDIIRRIRVVQDRAYVAAGTAGLRVVNVADPAAPNEIGFYNPPVDFAKDLYVVGSTVYVADDRNGLRIVDVTNAAAPREVGRYDTPGNAEGIYVSGNLAYVADGAAGLRIINVSTPAVPTEAGNYPAAGYTQGVYGVGNTIYLVGDGLHIVDVSTPAAPGNLGFYSGESGSVMVKAVAVQVVGNTAYLANSSDGLLLVDVTTPAAASELGVYAAPDYAGDLSVVDGTAYLANGEAGLRIANITNKAAPSEVGFYDPLEAAQSVYVTGSLAYVADGGRGLRIVDVTNTAAPHEIGSYDTPFNAFDVFVVGSVAYVADGNTLHLINVANPAAPAALSDYTPPGLADIRAVYVANNIAYVANGTDGVRIVNVANPTAPTPVGYYDTPGSVADLYGVGNTLYVADSTNGVLLLNVAEPTAPVKITADESLPTATGIYAAGGTIYVAAGDAGLHIFNLTLAGTLNKLGDHNTPGSAQSVVVVGATAYLADLGGLYVVNVANPAAPSLAGFYDISSYAESVAVSSGIVYLTGRDAGLFLLKYPPCYLLTISQQGAGALPLANPLNSPGCSSGEYLPGAQITLSANPALDWQVAGWVGTKNDNSSARNNLVEMPAIEHEVSVIYTPVCYALTLTHSGAGNDPVATPLNSPGCATGQYMAGATVALSATPAAGHAVSGWSGTASDASSANQNSLTMPGRQHTVNVNYTQVCFGLSLTHTGNGGAPTVSPPQSDACPAQSYRNGATITVTANPGAGYTIGGWNGTTNDGSTALTNNVTMPATDHTVAVTYTLACYALTLTHSGDGSDPVVTPGQSSGCAVEHYHIDTPLFLSVTPAAGWQVSSWSGADNNDLTTVTNTLTMPGNDHLVRVTYRETPLPGAGDGYEMDDTCTRHHAIARDGSEVQEHTFHTANDVDWVRFNAQQGKEYRIEVTTPPQSVADVALELRTACDGALEQSQDFPFAPGVRLNFTATTSMPVYLKLQNSANGFGLQARYQLSVRTVGQEGEPGALLLVAGRLYPNDSALPNIYRVTDAVYQMYLNHGYNDDRIFYLAPEINLPTNLNLKHPNKVDALAATATVQEAITQWAQSRVAANRAFTLYLMDHGSAGFFYLDKQKQEWLTPEQLDGWLDTLEEAVPNLKINIIIEACYSGSFLNALRKPNRVVITSTDADSLAWAKTNGGAQFSDLLIEALNRRENLFSSYQAARLAAMAAHPDQAPLLDGDGGGQANEAADQIVAAARGFSFGGTLDEQWQPYIAAAEPPVQIQAGKGVLRARVLDDQQVGHVWAVVYPPSYTAPTGSDELVQENLPTITLLPQGDGWYSAEYVGFSEAGAYRLVFYADDNEGLDARPVALTIVNGSRLYLPVVVR